MVNVGDYGVLVEGLSVALKSRDGSVGLGTHLRVSIVKATDNNGNYQIVNSYDGGGFNRDTVEFSSVGNKNDQLKVDTDFNSPLSKINGADHVFWLAGANLDDLVNRAKSAITFIESQNFSYEMVPPYEEQIRYKINGNERELYIDYYNSNSVARSMLYSLLNGYDDWNSGTLSSFLQNFVHSFESGTFGVPGYELSLIPDNGSWHPGTDGISYSIIGNENKSYKDEVLYGGRGNDTITGDDGSGRIIGRAGDDILYGGAGNDTLSYADAF